MRGGLPAIGARVYGRIRRDVNYELLVGWRYTRAERRNHFVSFISLVSMLGIALGVAALIVVLSVVNGFQREFRDRILAVAAHVQVSGYDGQLADWREVAARVTALPGVAAVAPFINAQVMISLDTTVRGVLLRGIDPALEARTADVERHMRSGRLDALVAGGYGVVLGSALADALGAKPGDPLAVVAPRASAAGDGLAAPRLKQLRVVGTFEIGMHEYDSALALVHLDDARELFETGDAVSGVRLKVDDPFRAPAIAARVAALAREAAVTDWTRSHANLFYAVQTSRNMLILVLALIIAVAAFNIIATLVMAVADKEPDIAILRTLGATPGAIQRIFVIQGVVIGVVGTAAGVILGCLLAWNVDTVVRFIESLTGIRFLDPSVYQIGALPSELRLPDVIATAVVSLVLSLAATLYPSYRAARLRPADALRYE